MTDHLRSTGSIVEDDGLEAAAEVADEIEATSEQVASRIDLGGRTLREHTAKGAVINGLFQVGLGVLGLAQRVGVAVFLTATEYGLWGLLITTLITLAWLKQIGVGDKFIQQDESDQELAFQKAFTIELAYSAILFGVCGGAMVLYALFYGRPEMVVPGIVLSLYFLLSALESPVWIPYRQMRFVRQRTLEAVNPIVAAVVTLACAAGGVGYWSLVIGVVAGGLCGATVAIVSCPYPLRLRWDRGALREYFAFSWPLLMASASGLIIVQGSVVVGNFTVGLAGLGAIGLASNFSMFADRVDALVRRTIYPAVCAVKDKRALLFEAFTKSNRLALMWAFPFGVGLALFAGDLVTFVLGERWRVAEPLLQTFGVVIAFRQVAFNWVVFFSAVGETRPMAVSGVVAAANFLLVTVPLMYTAGLTGYAIGMSIAVALDLGVRSFYLGRFFRGFQLARHLLRSVAPCVPVAALILGLRSVSDVARSPELVLAELGLYVGLSVLAIYVFERALISEAIGYLRRGLMRPVPG